MVFTRPYIALKIVSLFFPRAPIFLISGPIDYTLSGSLSPQGSRIERTVEAASRTDEDDEGLEETENDVSIMQSMKMAKDTG